MKRPLALWKSYTDKKITNEDIAQIIKAEHEQMSPVFQKYHSELLNECTKDIRLKVFPYSVTWMCRQTEKKMQQSGEELNEKTVSKRIVDIGGAMSIVRDPNEAVTIVE